MSKLEEAKLTLIHYADGGWSSGMSTTQVLYYVCLNYTIIQLFNFLSHLMTPLKFPTHSLPLYDLTGLLTGALGVQSFQFFPL